MAEAPEVAFPVVMASLSQQLDRREHDALSADDIQIFQTPEGMTHAAAMHLSIMTSAYLESSRSHRTISWPCICIRSEGGHHVWVPHVDQHACQIQR